MKHITADDGRVLTPPKELEPLLKDVYPAFSFICCMVSGPSRSISSMRMTC